MERWGNIQSAITMVEELSSLLNSAGEPILTEEGIANLFGKIAGRCWEEAPEKVDM